MPLKPGYSVEIKKRFHGANKRDENANFRENFERAFAKTPEPEQKPAEREAGRA